MNTTLIRMVISTMNTIEVKGKENLSSMLGCIEALENVVQMMEAPSAPLAAPVTGVNAVPPDEGMENVDTQEVANGR